MTIMTLELDDSKADAFRVKARQIGLEPEQLLSEIIDDIINQPEADFDSGVDDVLAKNRELYRRLA
ncbi:MAG: hypothetical protein K9M02_20645 [Thiohalocapsa sp.]|nr:hypothetical protein [Thiohalocapsa sp.]